jgi:alkylhydroperoxidase family enzyme
MAPDGRKAAGPGNISLLQPPSYSPELNPVENIWQFLRQNHLGNRVFKSYTDIVDPCCTAWNALAAEPKRIASIATQEWASAIPLMLLPPETGLLIREQVARINLCLFCIDIGRWATIKASMSEAKFDALEQYGTSPLFTDAERAALDYVTELTKDKKVNPDTFARMSCHYSERAICEIVWLVASEHFYNMTNIGLNIHSDMLCDISRKEK